MRVCPQCGRKWVEGEAFCPFDGARLRDVAAAHPFNYCALRYFNVAGADPHGRSGQSTAGATHLIKVAVEAATGGRTRW